MMSAFQDRVQLTSDAAATVCVAVALALMAASVPDSWRDPSVASANVSQTRIELSLEPVAAAAPPAPRAPPPPDTPTVRTPHQPAHQTRLPAPAPLASIPVTPDSDAIPEGGEMIAASSAAAAPQADVSPDLDAQYAAGLRADIDRRNHPPDSVQYRLRRPSGEVQVGFIVLRSGEVRSVRVLRSSGSSMLDSAAATVVADGHYPQMPQQAYSGEAQHVFAVTIEFRGASSDRRVLQNPKSNQE